MDSMFKVNKDEMNSILMSQNVISSWGGNRKLPHAFTEQVKNNIDKFDRDFRFQLNKEEYEIILRSKKSTSSWGGTRKLPYAFAGQGIYMLMTVLKGYFDTIVYLINIIIMKGLEIIWILKK